MKRVPMKARANHFKGEIFLLLVLSFIQITEILAQSENPENSQAILRKGVVFAGFSGGASLRESENENALVVTIQDQSKKGYNLIFAGGYMLKPEFAVGAAIRYDQSRVSKSVIDSDGIVSDIQEAGSIITSSIYVKNFIPLASNGRINLYNLAGIAWVADRNTSESFTQDVLTRTYTNKNALQLGISPGIQVFVAKGFATEVGVNVAGLSATRKEVAVNGVDDSSVNTLDLDLRVNILSLNISFYYYFPIRK
jgi:hypothetical protein